MSYLIDDSSNVVGNSGIENQLLFISINIEGEILDINSKFSDFLFGNDNFLGQNQNILSYLSELDARTLKSFLVKNNLDWGETFDLRFTNPQQEFLNTICVYFEEDSPNTYRIYFKNITKSYGDSIIRYQDENKILKTLFDFVPHPVYIKDKNRAYTYVNKAFCTLYNTTKKRVIKNTDDILIINPEEAKIIRETDEIVLQKEEDSEIPHLNFTKKSGEKVILFSLKIPILDYRGQTQIMGISIDITNRKKIRQELDLTNYELDNFLYHTSHELKSPIKTIKGLIFLANNKKNVITYEDSMDKIGKTIYALDGYIDHLTDYLTNKRNTINYEKINFYELFQKEVALIKAFYNINEIKVNYNFDTDFTIYSDYARLKIIIDNVIKNAIKNHKIDSVIIPILEISITETDKYKICVTDNGLGLYQKELEKIFDMYFRGEKNYSNDSSGLGMYILKETISKINGEIFIVSEPNNGTTVTILLPK